MRTSFSPAALTPPPRTRRRRSRTVAVLVALGLLAAACTSDGGDGGDDTSPGGQRPDTAVSDQTLRLLPLSTRAEYATNGNLLVGIDSPAGLALDDVEVRLDGRDVTSAFAYDDAPHNPPGTPARLVGLVSGMVEGPNQITATLDGEEVSLAATGHTVDGPLFSGPQQSPLVCTTGEAGLGPPQDDCWAQSIVRWMYRTTDGRLRDLVDPAATPADVATIEVNGAQVPFVIRIEKAVLNRSITSFAMLDPVPGAPAGPTPGNTPVRAWDDSGWNGRLVHRFGGGCGATFSQGGDSDDAAVDIDLLSDGYAIVASSLTTFATACNDVVAAETVMVAKEHFSEAYGRPRFTIGDGGSGGAIQQLLIAQNYPGLLDAVAPAIPFPDAMSIAGGVADCGLLGRWFGDSGAFGGLLGGSDDGPGAGGGAALTDDQRLAISGFATNNTCGLWRATYLENIDPTEGCATELQQAGQVFDPESNPRGVRCTLQDSNVNLLGTDRDTGYALSPLDNQGVQYGLEALDAGAISVDDFLALNEGIGGYDINGIWQPERTRASDEVLTRAYEEGRVSAGTATADAGALSVDGAGGLVDVPVLLANVYNDPLGDIHDRQRIFAIRDRLRLPDGTENPNVVLWTVPGITDLTGLMAQLSGNSGVSSEAVRLLDEWLTDADLVAADGGAGAALAAARPGDPWTGAWTVSEPVDGADSGIAAVSARAALLAEARPGDGADRCRLPDGHRLTGPDAIAADGPCNQAYPVHADPRQVAGAPLVGTTLACTLVPVDASAYEVEFSPAQADRLAAVFPDGVCDWSAPGRHQRPLTGTWLSFD